MDLAIHIRVTVADMNSIMDVTILIIVRTPKIHDLMKCHLDGYFNAGHDLYC